MIEKEFVKYEEALALKELGFDEPCFGYFNTTWSKENELLFPQYAGELENWNNTQHLCSAPLYQQAFRWLYQKLGIEKGVMPLDIESQQLLLDELLEQFKNQ